MWLTGKVGEFGFGRTVGTLGKAWLPQSSMFVLLDLVVFVLVFFQLTAMPRD